MQERTRHGFRAWGWKQRYLTALGGTAALAGAVASAAGGCSDDTEPPVIVASSQELPPFTNPQDIILSEQPGSVVNLTTTCQDGSKIGDWTYHALKYSTGDTAEGSLPGPTLRLKRGETFSIHVNNQMIIPPDQPNACKGASTIVPADPIACGGEGGGGGGDGGEGGGHAHGPVQKTDTNMHTHGLHVSPKDDADNIYRTIAAGDAKTFSYEIPNDHPSGLFWYHPHQHESSDHQVAAGLAGAIIVKGPIDDVEGIKDAPERVMVMQAIYPERDSTSECKFDDARPQCKYGVPIINGLDNSKLEVQAGKMERWRLLNASSDNTYKLWLSTSAEGAYVENDSRKLYLIALDGVPFNAPREVTSLALATGQRAEVLVVFNENVPMYLRSEYLHTTNPEKNFSSTLVTVDIQGDPVETPPTPPTTLPGLGEYGLEDLCMKDASGQCTKTLTGQTNEIKFSQAEGDFPMTFFINDVVFEPSCADVVTAQLGSIDEWTLINDSPYDHPFHIHVNPFQVISVTGENLVEDTTLYRDPTYRDTIIVPRKVGTTKGQVVFRTLYKKWDGQAVFHCHILVHEDMGMMANFSIVQ